MREGNPAERAMTKLVYPFLLLAVAGLAIDVVIHITSLTGSTGVFDLLGKYTLLGIFVVWFPAIFAMNRLGREFKQKDVWRAALRGCPKWMRMAMWTVFGYAWVGFFVLPLLYGGSSTSHANSARLMSGVALMFYSVAACVLYSATQAEKHDQGRRCTNGHRVGPLAKFCEECGAPVLDTTSSNAVGEQ
jgi:hypothetical protein